MPDVKMVNLTIDGKALTVPDGTLVVEAAKLLGIEIPVFCYHHKLEPVGACRMCLVEISPGPPVAQAGCIRPVAEGMVVRTQSAMAVQARADVLEFEQRDLAIERRGRRVAWLSRSCVAPPRVASPRRRLQGGG